MSLRRTPLVRKTPLRRTPLPRGKVELGRRRIKASTRRRDTGPSTAVRTLVLHRAGGACEVCGKRLRASGSWLGEHSFHHRRPRGMGGSSDPATNGAANLLLLCGSGTTGCHGDIESKRGSSQWAGHLLPQVTDPAEQRVLLLVEPYPDARAAWFLLDNDGGRAEVRLW